MLCVVSSEVFGGRKGKGREGKGIKGDSWLID